MHRTALGRVPGDRVGQVTRLVAVVVEGSVGEAPLPGRRVGLQQTANHDAVADNGLDPQDVAVGQASTGLTGLDAVVVAAADDQVPGRRLGTRGDPHRRAAVDQPEVDQVVADPLG